MANPEHVEIARKGRDAIRAWLNANPGKGLDLQAADLRGVDLYDSFLPFSNLSGADLTAGGLANSVFFRSRLTRAKLDGVGASRILFRSTRLDQATLLSGVFVWASFSEANLSRARLNGADLRWAILRSTNIRGADFAGAVMGGTSLASLDLSVAAGLDKVAHEAPSHIDVETLLRTYRQGGNGYSPQVRTFFQEAGVPIQVLDMVPEIAAEVRYFTCFVSYGQPDVGMARRLYDSLQARGVLCWVYELDKTPGERTWREIGERRREADKMIVLCSAAALVREGVRKEIEEQIDEDPEKLIPISLDNLWRELGFRIVRGERDLKPFLLERNYADFSDVSNYESEFEKLLKALRRP